MALDNCLRVAPYGTGVVIDRFFHAHVAHSPLDREELRDIHARYVAFCLELGYTPLPTRSFGRYIRAPRQRSNGRTFIPGVRLL
jgi:hypothetical protein